MAEKKKRKLKTSAKIILVFAFLILAILVELFFLNRKKEEEVVVVTPTPTIAATATPTPRPENLYHPVEALRLKEELQEDQEINQDVVAIFTFNSDLIHEPIVYDPNNNTYLRRNWKTKEYDPVGTAFLDYRNDFQKADQNTIIYGHYVEPSYSSDRTIMFTPIELLREKEHYEENKDLVLATDEGMRYYQIVAVMDAPVETVDGLQYAIDSLQYNLVEYEPEYYKSYCEEVKKYAFYEADIEMEEGDRLLTLQTCVSGNVSARLVLIAKEIYRETWDEVEEAAERVGLG